MITLTLGLQKFSHRFLNKRALATAATVLTLTWAVVVMALIHIWGDRWWIGTLVMFAPRWVLALPALACLGCWSWLSKKFRISLLLTNIAGIWLILGFCIPLQGWQENPNATCRLLSCNVAYWRGGTEELESLIVESKADIVVLQEYGYSPHFALPADWHSQRAGELFIASRFPLKNRETVRRDLPGRWPREIALSVEVETPERTFRLVTLHLLSPRNGLDRVVNARTLIAPEYRRILKEETHNRTSESNRVAESLANRKGDLIVIGDFNMPVESAIYNCYWRKYRNAYSEVGFGIGNTVSINKRGFDFRARIDHVLTQGNLRAYRCWVGPSVGSDHFPVLADIDLGGG